MADFAKENQFTPDQQAEIDAGIKDNIDVSIYAKPEFLAIQMHEIRIGLVEQIPVSYYADSRYDWFQMEEIRKGLEMSLDVRNTQIPRSLLIGCARFGKGWKQALIYRIKRIWLRGFCSS